MVIDAVIAHAREAAPDECCGVLLGRDDDIVAAVRARNIAAAPASRFLIDPKDHFDARREARRTGLDVVGFYHSHPGTAAAPSEIDLAEASYPDHLYLIVGLGAARPDLQLYRLVQNRFRAMPFRSYDGVGSS
jgi:proteasome lid subunit RPN8/RPN11